jgi:type II secretory pathway pseudopilin PulG
LKEAAVAVPTSRRRAATRVRVTWARDDAGFTLVEAVVAAAVLAFVIAATVYALTQNVQLTGVAVNRSTAANLATQALEQLRNENSNGRALDSDPYPVTVHGVEYTVTPALAPAATTSCAPGTVRRVSVTVAPSHAPSRSARYDSVLTC